MLKKTVFANRLLTLILCLLMVLSVISMVVLADDSGYTLTVTADTEEGKSIIGEMNFFTTGWSENGGSNYTGTLNLDTPYTVTLKTTAIMVLRAQDVSKLTGVKAISITVDGETKTLPLSKFGNGSNDATSFGDSKAFQHISAFINDSGTYEGHIRSFSEIQILK